MLAKLGTNVADLEHVNRTVKQRLKVRSAPMQRRVRDVSMVAMLEIHVSIAENPVWCSHDKFDLESTPT